MVAMPDTYLEVDQGSPVVTGDEEIDMLVDLNMNDNKITNLKNPTNPYDAATKAYVDGGGGGSGGSMDKKKAMAYAMIFGGV
jgi:hypothetical protein